MPHRRISTAITLVVLMVLVVVFGVVGLNALFAPIDDGSDGTAEPTCTPQRVKSDRKVTTEEVTVSVFNASDRSGLANDTLTSLADRGFKLGDAGNAPDGSGVRFVQVWTTEEKDPAARLVALQFGPKTVIKAGDDLGPGVDVIVGQRFEGVVDDAPSSVKSRSTEKVCVPEE